MFGNQCRSLFLHSPFKQSHLLFGFRYTSLRFKGSVPNSANELQPEVGEIRGSFIPAEIDPIATTHRGLRSPFQTKNFVRLDKLLANLGLVTRRNAVNFIKTNNITVAIGIDEYQEFDHVTNSVVTKEVEVLKRVPYSSIVYPPSVRYNAKPLEFVEK